MREATRRQILSDIGITLWRLRASEDDPGRSDLQIAISSPEDRDPRRPSFAPGELRSPEIAPAEREQRQTDRSRRERDRSQSQEKPWSVLSLTQGGAVLLVDGESSRRDLKLAQDILAAAAGDWRGRPGSRRFRWPPELGGETLQPGSDGGRRALNAFVDKDIADHGARLLLCTEPFAALLEDAWPGCRRVTIPALDVLGREPDAKRTLWRDIRQFRS